VLDDEITKPTKRKLTICENHLYFFLLSQEIGQASRGSNHIPTRLAPHRTPILYRQYQRKFY